MVDRATPKELRSLSRDFAGTAINPPQRATTCEFYQGYLPFSFYFLTLLQITVRNNRWGWIRRSNLVLVTLIQEPEGRFRDNQAKPMIFRAWPALQRRSGMK